MAKKSSIKNRIKELRYVKAKELLPNAKNWRKHPERQRAALKGVLEEIGYAGALLARETDDGKLALIDGHLRAETTPDQKVPVLVLDVTEKEANKILATLDPLAAMAETDETLLQSLLNEIESDSDGISDLLSDMFKQDDDTEIDMADDPEDIDIKPYDRAHILITVPMRNMHLLAKFEELAKKEGVEYETSGN